MKLIDKSQVLIKLKNFGFFNSYTGTFDIFLEGEKLFIIREMSSNPYVTMECKSEVAQDIYKNKIIYYFK